MPISQADRAIGVRVQISLKETHARIAATRAVALDLSRSHVRPRESLMECATHLNRSFAACVRPPAAVSVPNRGLAPGIEPATQLPVLIRQVITILQDRLDQRVTMTQVGALVGRSPWHLNVLFKQWTHLSLHEYGTRLRMIEAVAAIRRGTKIEVIALELGNRSAKTFYRQFKQRFGISPAMLRASPAA